MKTLIILNTPPIRLRTRRVNEQLLASDLADSEEQGWIARVRHGGSVCNSYGYRAETEAALAVRDPHGRVVVWIARLAANKVTQAGAADACLPGTRALWDSRVKSQDRINGAWRALKATFHRALIERLPHGEVAEALAPGALDALSPADLEALCAEHDVEKADGIDHAVVLAAVNS